MPPPDPLQYDEFAAGFEEHATRAPYNALYDRPAVLELVGDVEGKRVLDAGCGPGLYLAELIDRGAAVIGCDSSPAMVELARSRIGENGETRVHSLEDPFEWLDDHSVDLAISTLVYHHITNRIDLLREMRRVIRPGGSLVLSTTHPMWDWVRLGGSYFEQDPVAEIWSTGWEVTSYRLPLSRLHAEFRAAGLTIDELVEPLPAPEMAEAFPEDFEQLTTSPAFIVFRLVAETH